MPVDEVRTGNHELVAAVVVQTPWTCVTLDNGLEGAKAALGGCGFAGEVDGRGLGFRACQRLAARQEDSWFGGSGAAEPDRLESGVEHGIGVGD